MTANRAWLPSCEVVDRWKSGQCQKKKCAHKKADSVEKSDFDGGGANPTGEFIAEYVGETLESMKRKKSLLLSKSEGGYRVKFYRNCKRYNDRRR